MEDSYQEETEITRINGKPGLTLQVQKLANANTVNVVDNVKRTLPKLTGIPQVVQVSMSSDQSLYIRQTIAGLAREALIGALLAMLIILVFIRNMRGTLIIVTAIPLSILITFIMFRFGNVTLNIMTFGGLALAVGRLVDDSIVALEVSYRHYNKRRAGQTKMEATLEAAKEVASPILVSTLATVIVFLPVVFLTGVAKLLFVPLTITIAVALFGSYFVSRTVTPLMCYRYLPPEKPMNRDSRKPADRLRVAAADAIERLDNWYEQGLRWTLSHRRLVIGVSSGSESCPRDWSSSSAPSSSRTRTKASSASTSDSRSEPGRRDQQDYRHDGGNPAAGGSGNQDDDCQRRGVGRGTGKLRAATRPASRSRWSRPTSDIARSSRLSTPCGPNSSRFQARPCSRARAGSFASCSTSAPRPRLTWKSRASTSRPGTARGPGRGRRPLDPGRNRRPGQP